MDSPANTTGPAGDRRQVLVIEDQPAIRDLLRDLLGFLGFEVECAADGASGLARFAERPYDLVLTDLMMPGLSGWDVVRGVRARSPGTPVIMVTGTAGDADQRRALAENVPLVCKPFRIGALERLVHDTLGRRD